MRRSPSTSAWRWRAWLPWLGVIAMKLLWDTQKKEDTALHRVDVTCLAFRFSPCCSFPRFTRPSRMTSGSKRSRAVTMARCAGCIRVRGDSGSNAQVVLTMQKLLLTGSDVFYALNHVSSPISARRGRSRSNTPTRWDDAKKRAA
jgi:hypothetical protein